MSRIGKMPVSIPSGVTVDVDPSNVVTVKGQLGTLSQKVDTCITVKVENNEVVLTRSNDTKPVKAKHGLYRALIHNMVEGVSKGYKKSLVCKSVGLKIQKQGNKVVLAIGYSNPVDIVETDGITLNVVGNDTIEVNGIDKDAVGQFASKIRQIKPVEPYHGYGIRYSDEVVIMKEGKKAGKK